MSYNVIICGGGQTGLFTAYELIKNNPSLKILVIEKGKHLNNRKCPNITNNKCVKCKPCNIVNGLSGSGAFSDSKLSLSPNVGGNISDYIGFIKTQELINYLDNVYIKYGADTKVNWNENKDKISNIIKKAIQNNMELINCPVRHLGTEKSQSIYYKIIKELENKGVEFLCNTAIDDIIVEDNKITGVLASNKTYKANKVVLCMGREGSKQLNEICKRNNIQTNTGIVDIGVRVECKNEVMKEINENLYEGKLLYHTPTYNDKVRTFCSNPSGYVTREKYPSKQGDIFTVNGHAYKDKHSENTNFALLVTKQFTEPFKDPIGYGEHIARLSNMLSGNSVIIQKYGDFKKGRRTTQERLIEGEVIPTLKDAVAGDLSLVLPYRIMKDIEETIESLNGITSGINSDDTLLYGVEVKFFGDTPKTTNNFQSVDIDGLYFGGDCTGISHGLMQSGCMGLVIARNILKDL